VGNFSLLEPDPDPGSTDMIESGSETLRKRQGEARSKLEEERKRTNEKKKTRLSVKRNQVRMKINRK
jgi:hypothetical protein